MTMADRSKVIRDVTIFTPDGRVEGDCLIENGRIAEIGEVTGTADTEIDGKGRWLWPGAIDGHVHFREPGPTYKEDWHTGSSAAVAGGVTTVFEMPNTKPTTTTVERLREKRALASEKTLCNFGLFFGAGPNNHDEIRKAQGVPGLKIFMGCSTGDLLVYREEDLDEVFAAWLGKVCVHAESELRLRERAEKFEGRDDPKVHSEIRDPRAAAEAVELATKLALDHGRDLHVLHLSTLDELEVLDAAREKAQEHGLNTRITCEVCPHHLFMNTDAYDEWGTRVRMNPPLRSEEHRKAMWEGLDEGAIQMIATDHAPHTIEEKDRPYREAPSGVPGVETMLPLMLDAAHRGECSYEDVLEWVCHAPAEIYGVVGRSKIEQGNHADLVLIDPKMTREVRDEDQFTKCQWTPWAGRELTGWPVLTLVNGEVAYRRDDDGRGEVVGRVGMGVEVEFE
ncbi:dihydroorotase [Persicimonas caeni]|uniref:Dihydroorotase n=2 Tax=Persicimonas caeni TaxID=2292766 RepID=A0A4Y6PUX9_PERCE|nr:dihydroorotase [Persicimonas caeni]QED33028.1 dihydroorotase [Persicimonas caeni]